MSQPRQRLIGFILLLPVGVGIGLAAPGSGCSSSNPTTPGTGGSTASSGGSSAGTGGATSTGGVKSTGGTTGSGGAAASGGTPASSGGSSVGSVAGGGGSTGAAAMGGGGTGGAGNGGRTAGAGGGGSTGAGGGTIPSTLILTSPVLSEGGLFPSTITCADAGMGSPELDWTPGPSGTMSYAVTLTDLTNGFIHWAIWNIPVPNGGSTKVTLPANLATTAMLTTPMGAMQTNRFSGKGYYGPCPGGTSHMYQFQVYAIPAASLTGTTTSTDTASASMRAVATATGALTGTSNAKR